MTAKHALVFLLVVFVGTVAFSLAPQFRSTPAGAVALAATDSEANPSPSKAEGDKIIAYYFHVTVRCQTCLAIERYSEEAVKQSFADELAVGKIEWRPVNVQLPENRHFVKDYKLFTRSLVYVLMKDGRQVKYKVLDKTWELVGQEKWLKNYVTKEMDKYLRRLG